ncbi:Hypothetical predicted protein [Lecanosticta acicola]|uniref:Uncharacterized protein n=1 Tax=Lecanosticta acicola TaxID=111012 RepID=A0AAI8YXV1_9PEZI|nr:Hypothetical predicted protein [Lecanosticta acicola]
MAAPKNLDIKDLNGTTWIANRSLSGDSDSVLALQGVHYVIRTILSAGQITVCIKQWEGEDGATHFEMQNQISAGLPGLTDTYKTDFEPKQYSDPIFGTVRDRSRWIGIEELEDEYQKTEWEEGTTKTLELFTDHLDTGATTSQVCGFELIEGERRYTRRLVVKKGEEVLHVRLVFDYVGGEDLENDADAEDDSEG